MVLFFAAQFQGQMICFTIKVWICWCTSVFFYKHLIELSPILSIAVGQIVKTKGRRLFEGEGGGGGGYKGRSLIGACALIIIENTVTFQ